MSRDAATPRSPFFSRAYGGFTNAQEGYYLNVLGDVAGRRILDPMAGQGYSLSKLAFRGAEVWCGDLNPAPLLLASLRDPIVVAHRDDLVKWILELLSRVSRKSRVAKRTVFYKDWIAPSTRNELSEYGRAIGLGLFDNPFSFENDFWDSPLEHRFAAGIPVLAARSLACFRSSDNLTWLKPGGLLRERGIYGPVKRALLEWVQFAETAGSNGPNRGQPGSVCTHRMDVERGVFGRSPLVDAVVTSPPYANRLDYTRMWVPEMEVLAAMSGQNPGTIKEDQIGTTVVAGQDDANGEETKLPNIVRIALDEIRKDPTEFSESYYYPFFRNYAVALARGLKTIASRLNTGGILIIFVRDTVRKDVLFPTGELVTKVLTGEAVGLRRIEQERRVIKSHVGFRRKGSSRGFYGLAQQEWWIALRKES